MKPAGPSLTFLYLLFLLPLALCSQGIPLESILRDGVKPNPSASSPGGEAPGRGEPTAPPAKPLQSGAGDSRAGGGGLPFAMKLAPGWRARLSEESGAVAQSPDGRSIVAILPVMNMGRQSPAEWLKKNGAGLLSRYLPNASLSAIYPSKLGTSGALVALSYEAGGQQGKSSALLYTHGGDGTLYVVGSPVNRFEQDKQSMLAMLRSFTFNGAPSDAAALENRSVAVPQLSYRKYRDPNEGAFTLDVPANWKVEGGIVRRSEVDINSYVQAVSPEGLVVVIGDANIPKFTTPTQMLAMSGLGEGARYSPFPGNVMIVQRYIPGAAYAHLHAGHFAQRMGVSGLRIHQPRERAELRKTIPSIGVTTTGGDVRFGGTRSASACEGYVLASTSIMTMQGVEGGMWNVQSLVSYVGPAGMGAIAEAVIARMLGSIQMNPHWVAQQRRESAEAYRAVKETNDYIAGLFRETREYQQRVQDRQNREFGDYIRGVVRLRDTESGEVFEGRAGNNYYWRIRHSDTLVGSDISVPPPNIDLTEMEQVR